MTAVAGYSGLVRAKAKDESDDDKVDGEDLSGSDYAFPIDHNNQIVTGMTDLKATGAAGLFDNSGLKLVSNTKKKNQDGSEDPKPPRRRFDN